MLKVLFIILLVIVLLPALAYLFLCGSLFILGCIVKKDCKKRTKKKRFPDIKYKRYQEVKLMSFEQYLKKKDKMDIVKEEFVEVYGWDNQPIQCVKVTYLVTIREYEKRS